jgi:hypothetical protein
MSEFGLITVREIAPGLSYDPHGLLCPIPGEGTNQIAIEPRDGSQVVEIPVKGLTLRLNANGSSRRLGAVSDVKVTLYVTDARVAFACSKFDKGGGWIGGIGTMVVFNSVSKMRAAMRRRGKMLVGHVRYPWLDSVGGSPKRGFGDEERLRLVVPPPDGNGWLLLDLDLPKNVDSPGLAADIARRAARHRIAHGADAGALASALEARPLVGEKKKFALHEIEGAVPPGEQSARG